MRWLRDRGGADEYLSGFLDTILQIDIRTQN